VLAAENELPSQLDREHVGDGIEADDDLAALALDRLGDAVGEVRHGHASHVFNLLRPPERARGRFRGPSGILGGDVPALPSCRRP
jgi:hypothetical protein